MPLCDGRRELLTPSNSTRRASKIDDARQPRDKSKKATDASQVDRRYPRPQQKLTRDLTSDHGAVHRNTARFFHTVTLWQMTCWVAFSLDLSLNNLFLAFGVGAPSSELNPTHVAFREVWKAFLDRCKGVCRVLHAESGCHVHARSAVKPTSTTVALTAIRKTWHERIAGGGTDFAQTRTAIQWRGCQSESRVCPHVNPSTLVVENRVALQLAKPPDDTERTYTGHKETGCRVVRRAEPSAIHAGHTR